MKYNTILFLSFLIVFSTQLSAQNDSPGAEVTTIVQHGHYIYDFDVSSDGKYLVSACGPSIALWDIEKRRIIKTISSPNDGRVRLHPTTPGVIYVTEPTTKVPDERAYIGLNIFTGEKSGMIMGKDLPKRNSYHDDFILKLKNGKISVMTRRGRRLIGFIDGHCNLFPHGGMAINSNDSLLAIAGQYPLIWNIRDLKTEYCLDYRSILKKMPYLTFPEHDGPPLQTTDSLRIKQHDYHYGYQDHFMCSFDNKDVLWMGGYAYGITKWILGKSNGYIIGYKGTESAPVYAFSDNGQYMSAATYKGLNMGSLKNGDLNYIKSYGDPQYKLIYGISRPFGNGMFATAHDNGCIMVGKYGDKDFSTKLFTAGSSMHHVTVSPDEKRLITGGQMGALYEIPLSNPEKRLRYNTDVLNMSVIWKSCFLDNERFVIGDSDGQMAFWTSGTKNPRKTMHPHGAAVRDLGLTHSGKFLISSDAQGSIAFWDPSSEKLLATGYSFDHGKNYLIITPDNYYKGSKGAFGAVHFARGMDIFPLEQFDLKFNRPDIVMKRLGAPESKTEPYRKAWLKRLRKMGYKEETLSDELHAPELTIAGESDIEPVTADRFISLDITAKDTKYLLKKFFINLNGVPLLGKNGRDISAKRSKSYHSVEKVELCEGINTIEIFAINDAGAESYRKTLEILCEPAEKRQRKLFVTCVGVSKYARQDFNLEYAAKDADDISSLMKNGTGFSAVETFVLTDEAFSPASLKEIREFFSKAGRDDTVVLFYAGHGLLDSDLNYFLSHYSIDFENPASNGIAYEDFENLLEGVKAVKRLCLIDACHSGEIDKEDYLAENVMTLEPGTLKFRSAGSGIRKTKGHGVAQTRVLFNELFVDIRWGIGATVVSSAGGMEAAMEGKNWQNGLFTWCLKKGISDGSADTDGDNRISASELGEYLCKEVSSVSGGIQTPTMRAQNSRRDFYLTDITKQQRTSGSAH